MEPLLLSMKLQQVYSLAANRLAMIRMHPTLVKKGALGFFMSIENIKQAIISLNPADWYEGQDISFDDLPKEDQEKLTVTLKELSESISEDDLKEMCSKCGNLASLFDDKILARK